MGLPAKRSAHDDAVFHLERGLVVAFSSGGSEDSLRRFVHQVRQVGRTIVGKFFLPQVDVRCATVRLGTAYGGWELVAAGLNDQSVVYSFGIGEDVSFDLALIERFGPTVHAFDPTPKSLRWVERQSLPAKLVVHPYGLADRDDWLTFYPPENPEHVSHTILERAPTRAAAFRVPMKRLGTIMRELGHQHIDLLKLDVEGAEYAIIADLEQSSLRPGQLLVEFHHRFPGVGFARTRAAVAALRRMGYLLFKVSRSGQEYGLVLQAALRQ